MVVSIAALFTRGLNLGIDFEGGVSWEVSAPGVSVSDARDALGDVGEGNAKIQIVGSDTCGSRDPRPVPSTRPRSVRRWPTWPATDVGNVSVSTVGPSWGSEITKSAVRALVFFFIAILLYLSFRLEWRMAVAAIVAVLHDVLISVGVYSVFQFEVTPGTVIAFLTILGYSIYDTIVVDDKIQENERLVGQSGRMTYGQMTSLSMNQVLLRSLNTTITSLLPVISLLVVGAGIMGAVTLEEFSIALLVGLVVGAYSSIFVAAPVAGVAQGARAQEPGHPRASGRPGLRGRPQGRPPHGSGAARRQRTSTAASPIREPSTTRRGAPRPVAAWPAPGADDVPDASRGTVPPPTHPADRAQGPVIGHPAATPQEGPQALIAVGRAADVTL